MTGLGSVNTVGMGGREWAFKRVARSLNNRPNAFRFNRAGPVKVRCQAERGAVLQPALAEPSWACRSQDTNDSRRRVHRRPRLRPGRFAKMGSPTGCNDRLQRLSVWRRPLGMPLGRPCQFRRVVTPARLHAAGVPRSLSLQLPRPDRAGRSRCLLP